MNPVNILKERYGDLTNDSSEFSTSLQQPLKKSFRVNTSKSSVEKVKESFDKYGIELQGVKWCSEAFTTSRDALASIEHALGHIYFQELTSLLPVAAIKDVLENAQNVLDACAAPGSKTTHLSAEMKNRRCIVANDADRQRLRALRFNLEKTGSLNVVISNKDLLRFPDSSFDVIILDVPCSAEGILRKNAGAMERWSLQRIAACAALQKKLILKAFSLLENGGTMIYSTCTFAPEENESVLSELLEKTSAKTENIEFDGLKSSKGVDEWLKASYNSDVKKAVRIWPHQNDTSGFFIAKVVKC